jgi:hypothetical protein
VTLPDGKRNIKRDRMIFIQMKVLFQNWSIFMIFEFRLKSEVERKLSR